MHSQYKRIVDKADVAVLFVHGILGTPRHFDNFIHIVPRNWTIYNMLLDGHGGAVEDFSHTSMKKWEKQVEEAVALLSSDHKEIYIVAHSMGTLLAIEQAVKNSKIKKMFLLASPIRLFIRFSLVKMVLRVYFNRIGDNECAKAALDACGVRLGKNIFKYFGWLPRFFELFSKISKTRKILYLVDAECMVYQSMNDEMVSIKTVDMFGVNKKFKTEMLKNSAHYYYQSSDLEYLLDEFSRFIHEKNKESTEENYGEN